MSCSTLAPLWLDRFSMTTTSPCESVGTRHFSQAFLHPFLECGRVHRPVVGLLRHKTGKAQASDERDGLVMAMRNADAQSSTAPASSALARQIGGSPRFVNEHELPRIEIELRPKPLLAPLQDVGALLFLCMRGFFLNVISCRSKKRQITDKEKRSPQLAISRSWISNNVMSG